MRDEDLPLHDEAEAREQWRGDPAEEGADRPDDDGAPEPGVEKGLEIRPPD